MKSAASPVRGSGSDSRGRFIELRQFSVMGKPDEWLET